MSAETKRRAKDAENALAAYMSRDLYAGPRTAIIDFLSDARHYCDTLGLNFAEMDCMARMHYEAETRSRVTYQNHKAQTKAS